MCQACRPDPLPRPDRCGRFCPPARQPEKPRLVHLAEDIVHRILNGAGDGAVDRGGRRLVLKRPGVGGDTARRNSTIAQGPQEGFIPGVGFALLRSQRASDTLVGLVDGAVDGGAILALETILAVPDLERRLLQRDLAAGGDALQYRNGFSHGQSTSCEWDNIILPVVNLMIQNTICCDSSVVRAPILS